MPEKTNYTHQLLTMGDDKKYVVVNQTVYNDKTYILVVGVTPDGEDITDEVDILEEDIKNGLLYFNSVEDPYLFEKLAIIMQP